MKTLILITSQFPFGTGESFIESEFAGLVRNFEKIIIISQNVTAPLTRKIPDNIIVFRYNTSTSLAGYLYLPVLLCLNRRIIRKMIREEIRFRKSIHEPLTTEKTFFLIKKIIKAVQLRDFIREILSDTGINQNIVFYSYWLKTGAHSIAMLEYKDSIKISRAHGSDIYEEKTINGYLPFLKFSADNLDAIFFISENGKRYFIDKTKTDSPGFIVSRLGVEKPDQGNIPVNISDKFVIVSCSNMIPLKRIDLIIHSLEQVKTDKKILWMHFGDGILKDELQALAAKCLCSKSGIDYEFMGHYSNNDLLNFYSLNKIDLFINTSSTEGIPVSIMEAQSFGIPVIATDTGGVREIVREGTGTLLPVDLNPAVLADTIGFYTKLSAKEEQEIRMNASNNWFRHFNAPVNFQDFITKVNSILAAEKGST